MPRVRVLVVALLACGVSTGSTGVAGTALAEVSTDRPASFCSRARNIGDEFSQLNPSDFTDEDALQELRDAAKRLSKRAPRSLKKPFKTVIGFYDDLVDGGLDLSDPDAVEELTRQADKVARAAGKVIDYLVEKCDVTLE